MRGATAPFHRRRPVVILSALGVLLLASGGIGIVAGAFLSDWLFSLLPPVNVDAPAVGGATFALGVSLALGGLLHLGLAVLVARRVTGSAVIGAVLSSVMAVASVVLCIAALVSIAAGQGVLAGLVAAAIGLLVTGSAYAIAAIDLARMRQPSARV